MTEVVTLGECLIAFVATTPGPLAEATTFERFVAGAEANVAVGLARLGHDATYSVELSPTARTIGELVEMRARFSSLRIRRMTDVVQPVPSHARRDDQRR